MSQTLNEDVVLFLLIIEEAHLAYHPLVSSNLYTLARAFELNRGLVRATFLSVFICGATDRFI
jgi:hypothetical protein